MPERGVLIVAAENDRYLRGLGDHLRDAGVATVFAQDGEMAFIKAQSMKPDLMVTDILIPKLNGLELCNRIKGSPETRGVKVLISSMLMARERCLEAGADAFLPRTASRAQLARAVFGMLGLDVERDVIQDKLQKLMKLRKVIRAMTSLSDPAFMLKEVIKQVAEILDASGCAVLVKRGADILELGPSVGVDKEMVEDFTGNISDGIARIANRLWGAGSLASGSGTAAESGSRVATGATEAAQWETLISAPLIEGNDRLIGILVAVASGAGCEMGAEDEEVISALADLLTIAIRISRLQERIGVDAFNRDSLCSEEPQGSNGYQGYKDVITSLYDTVVKQMTDGIIVCDATGRIIQANRAAQRLLGLDAASMSKFTLDAPEIGLTTLDGKSPPHDEFPVNISLRTCRRVTGKEFSLKRWGIIIELSTFPLKTEECRVVGVVAVLRDITQRWELEKMKTNFVSVASHELRTPLTSIRAYVQLMLAGRMGQVDEKWRGALEVVSRNVERMTNIINDILDVARVGEGRLPLNKTEIDLADVAFMAVLEMGTLAANKNINIETQIPHGVIGEWDRQRLHQVFANLLDNAIKFTPPGGKIYVRVRAEGGAVHVEVQDTGRGINPSELTRIFEPFYQAGVGGGAGEPDDRGARGVGLGLAICKGIIEGHGGRIWAESYEGKGTTFHFTLPLREGDPKDINPGDGAGDLDRVK
ncbi:MAG TPA: response regulator [Firmicutes bacterium]|nr:response regulator [Bacillota bacterium]